MRRNHLGQYVSKTGRMVVLPRFAADGSQEGWWVHDMKTGKRRKADNLKHARELVQKTEG